MLTRRGFLVTTSLAAGAAAASTLDLQSAPPSDEWEAVRREFILDPQYVHLSLFFLTPHPRVVRDAIEHHRRELDRNPFLTTEHSLFDMEHPERTMPVRVATAIANYIGANAADIALTQNTTTGLSIVYHGLPLKAGDEIVTTTEDHYSHHESIRLAAQRAGATWRKVPLFESHATISADEIVERLMKAIGPKTRVLGITWVHSSSGLKLPIGRISEALAKVNAGRDEKDRVVLVVDGVHGIGVEDPKTATTGPDVFVAGTHKWLYAPRGTGFVWAKPEVWATMTPLIPTFSALETFIGWASGKPPQGPARANWFTPGGFQAYEHWWAVSDAINFHRAIGSERITNRVHALNERAKNELAEMPHVTLYTPRSRDLSAGIICFDVKGKTQNEVVKTLLGRHKILASTSPYPVSYARIAFSIQNSEADVEKTLKAIEAMG